MDTVIFILGIDTALVVVLTAAAVVMMFKMKGTKELVQWIDDIVGRANQRIGALEVSTNKDINEIETELCKKIIDASDVLSRNLGSVESELGRMISRQVQIINQSIDETLKESKSYVDSRFDKTLLSKAK